MQEHNWKVKLGRPGHLTEMERFKSELEEEMIIGSLTPLWLDCKAIGPRLLVNNMIDIVVCTS